MPNSKSSISSNKTKSPVSTKPDNSTLTYNQLQAELDQIVRALGDDETDIDEALELYRRGSQLIETLKARLELAKNTVTTLAQASRGAAK